MMAVLSVIRIVVIAGLGCCLKLAGALNVTSKVELLTAVEEGAPHIVIVEHLDLREAVDKLRYFQEADNDRLALGMLQATSFTRTIRGDCPSRTPGISSRPPLRALRPGQCVLITTGPLLHEVSTRDLSLWIDNVYLRLDRSVSHIAAANIAIMIGIVWSDRLWLTRSTLQGDMTDEGSVVGLALKDGARMFLDNVLVADLLASNYDVDTIGALVDNSTLAVYNTRFVNIRGVVFNIASSDNGYTISVRQASLSSSVAAVLLGRNVVFSRNRVEAELRSVGENATVYGDPMEGWEYFDEDDSTDLPVNPLRDAPQDAFLARQGDLEFSQTAMGAPAISADAPPLDPAPAAALPPSPPLSAAAQAPESSPRSSTVLGAALGGSIAGLFLAIAMGATTLLVRKRQRAQAAAKNTDAWKTPAQGGMAGNDFSQDPGVAPRGMAGWTAVNKKQVCALQGQITKCSFTGDLSGTAHVCGSAGWGPERVQVLQEALDVLHRNKVAYVGTYLMHNSSDRHAGGQGVVQFASDIHDPSKQYAIKFYVEPEAFARERDLYQEPLLREMMPATHEVIENEGGSIKTPEGFVFPPCIVIEKGESLDVWARREAHDFVTLLQVLCHVVKRLQILHKAGWAHLDIKPGNILRRPDRHSWTLIDFGCVARIGHETPLSFSPGYAPPEVIAAYSARQDTIVASPAVDMWALGIVAYEMVTRERAFGGDMGPAELLTRFSHNAPLPWEGTSLQAQEKLQKLRGLKRAVVQCLHRDPRQRPSSEQVLHSWNHMFDSTQTSVISTLSFISVDGNNVQNVQVGPS